MVIGGALTQAQAKYHLPPYENMELHMLSHALRPAGEGGTFMPPFARQAAAMR